MKHKADEAYINETYHSNMNTAKTIFETLDVTDRLRSRSFSIFLEKLAPVVHQSCGTALGRRLLSIAT
jgi:hypothetical protein